MSSQNNTPDNSELLGVKLTAKQRKLIMDRYPMLDEASEKAMRDTPPNEPVTMTLEAWDDLEQYIVCEANDCRDVKLTKQLDEILDIITPLVEEDGGFGEFDPAGPAFLKGNPLQFLLEAVRAFPGIMPVGTIAESSTVSMTPKQRDLLLKRFELSATTKDILTKAIIQDNQVQLPDIAVIELGASFLADEKPVTPEVQMELASFAQEVLDLLSDQMKKNATAPNDPLLPPFDEKKKSKQGKKSLKPVEVPDRPLFQLKIVLKDSDPPIWRRVLTPDCTLETLHAVIQFAMGWEFEHLYAFDIDGKQFGDPEDPESVSADEVSLSEFIRKGHKKLKYWYDFGDDWHHTITVEKVLPHDPKIKCATCTEAELACPPEDSGGIWGYYDMLEALEDKDHPEHDDMKEWIGKFDAEKCDLKKINRNLSRLKKKFAR